MDWPGAGETTHGKLSTGSPPEQTSRHTEDSSHGRSTTRAAVPPSRAPSSSQATRPAKGCLKPPTATTTTTTTARPTCPPRKISFEPSCGRCLVTDAPYEGGSSSRDGKTWRQQEAARLSERRTLLAAAADRSSQLHPRGAEADRWADRGWESAGLGEDTPMGGMSEDMDLQAALWRELDRRLDEQLALADRNRTMMEDEVRVVRRRGMA